MKALLEIHARVKEFERRADAAAAKGARVTAESDRNRADLERAVLQHETEALIRSGWQLPDPLLREIGFKRIAAQGGAQ